LSIIEVSFPNYGWIKRMAKQPISVTTPISDIKKTAKAYIEENATNEVVFAVVGYVGSGTSEIASSLKGLLESEGLPGGKFDVEILKARKIIEDWAKKSGMPLPITQQNDLRTTQGYQDLGDKMRSSGDHAIVARNLIDAIRLTRASRLGITSPGEDPVRPDGTRRAYILDSIRHPAEVELLRKVYQDAFVLVGVVCEANVRQQRIVKKYKNAGMEDAEAFMARDARAAEKHGQRVSDAFHMADFFVDNTVDQLSDGEPNEDWNINDTLSRLIKIMTAAEVVRPTVSETAMHDAYGAAMQSACLSRQVGAALLDRSGNVVATGTNEVPRAGGGVYGESFTQEAEDHRCVFQKMGRFCSNTREQNKIIDELILEIPELKDLDAIRKAKLKLELRASRVGDLLEFSRAVHAEMDAVFSAARKGITTVGTRLFTTASGAIAWYMPAHFLEGNKITFTDKVGKRRRKALVGWSDRRKVFWHLAVEGRPVLGSCPHFVLRQHVIFTADGKTPVVSKERMHLLRRRFCKNWWNDRWRDLLIGFVTWLGAGDGNQIAVGDREYLTLASDLMVVHSSKPMQPRRASPNGVAFFVRQFLKRLFEIIRRRGHHANGRKAQALCGRVNQLVHLWMDGIGGHQYAIRSADGTTV
jgi:deoxycytidylate deaminase